MKPRTVERMERAFRYYEIWQRNSKELSYILSRKTTFSSTNTSILPSVSECLEGMNRCEKKMELCRDYLMGKNTLQSAENDIESE
jgi:hypothetical protein